MRKNAKMHMVNIYLIILVKVIFLPVAIAQGKLILNLSGEVYNNNKFLRRGSDRASHPAALGLNRGLAKMIFSNVALAR